jgi:MFS family permease
MRVRVSLLLAVVATCNAAFRTTPAVRHWTTASRSPAIGCWIVQRSAARATVPHASGAVFGLPRDTFVPFALLLLAQFILFIGVGAVIPTLPLFAKESFGLSNAANGIVIGAPAIALLVLARPSGGFADEARKPAMMAGMGLIALSDLATALATELPVLVLARLGLGAGRCVSECGERGYLADLASRAPKYRGELAAAQQAVCALGIAVGSPLGGYAVEAYGPRAAFLCVVAAALVTLGLYALLPETLDAAALPARAPLARRSRASGAIASPVGGEADSTELWATLAQRDEWRGLAACQVGLQVGFAAKVTSVPLLAAALLPGGALAAGSLLSAAALTGLVGAPLGGWLADRQGARSVAVGAATISALGLMAVPLVLNKARVAGALEEGPPFDAGLVFSALILLWSLGVTALGPALTAIGQELAPKGSEATALALPRAVGDGAYILAPFLLGLVGDALPGVLGVECGVAGLVGLVGALVLARGLTET